MGHGAANSYHQEGAQEEGDTGSRQHRQGSRCRQPGSRPQIASYPHFRQENVPKVAQKIFHNLHLNFGR